MATEDAVRDLRRAVRAWALDARLTRERPRRPILVGESPADGREDWPALLGGPSCSRLASFVDRRWTWVVSEFERRNVRQSPGGAFGGGARRWDLRGRIVVVLGREAQAALVASGEWYAWHLYQPAERGLSATPCAVEAADLRVVELIPRGHALVVAIPHPSGLNRAYNDLANREAAGKVLREAVELAAVSQHGTSVLP